MKLALAAIALAAVVAQPASAACKWVTDCTGGSCKQVPVCDSALGIPPPRPPMTPTIAPPTIKPIESPRVPPVGTSSCARRYLCEAGKCEWKEVCR